MSKSISRICKNILMVCGTITALTGAVGGIVETVGKFSGGEVEAAEVRNSVVEQVIVSPPGSGKVRISKTIEIDGGGLEAASGDVPAEAPEYITMSSAPEVSWTDTVKNIWGWMLGIGFGVVVSIIGVGWWGKRKECNHESSGSR